MQKRSLLISEELNESTSTTETTDPQQETVSNLKWYLLMDTTTINGLFSLTMCSIILSNLANNKTAN